jgi:hypothetical protein
MLQLAYAAEPATLVHVVLDVAATDGLTPKAAVPALPDAQVRLTVCMGVDG